MAEFFNEAQKNIRRLKYFQAFEIQLTRLLDGWLSGVARWSSKWVPKLMEHYGYTQTLEELIKTCRNITAKHSVAPAQRVAIEKELALA